MAVVFVAAVGIGDEFVNELLAGFDQRLIQRRTVHLRGMNAVKVNRVRVRTLIFEDDAQPVALGAADARAGNATVVGPGRKHDSGRNFDLFVDCHKFVLAQGLTVLLGDLAVIPIHQHLHRVETVGGGVDASHRHVCAVTCVVGRRHRGVLRVGHSGHSGLRHALNSLLRSGGVGEQGSTGCGGPTDDTATQEVASRECLLQKVHVLSPFSSLRVDHPRTTFAPARDRACAWRVQV